MKAAEQLIEKIHQSGDDPVSFGFEERQLIYQWQRFAADMEVLKKYRPEFLEAGPQVRHRGPWAISISFSGGSVRVCYGSDIYTAARKAVEELEEIERLKGDNAALLKQWNDLDLRNEQRHHEWTDKLLTITAERDEARKELAALKSAPGMEEVDEVVNHLVNFLILEIGIGDSRGPRQVKVVKELADIARRSIASRDEAVELLKWLDEFWDFKEVKKCLCEYASDKVYGDNQQKARRIIEIVEGK